MGHGEHPACNPPEIGEADRFAWAWYVQNASLFVQEFGLMPRLLDDLRLDGMERQMFLARMAMIHATVAKVRSREIEKMSRER